MNLWKSTSFVLAGAIVCALAGAGIAALLSRLVPNYYAVVFPQAARMGLDPAEMGMGLGFVQGTVVGVVVSVVLVIVSAWWSHRGRLQQSLADLSFQVAEMQQTVRRMQNEMEKPGSRSADFDGGRIQPASAIDKPASSKN